MHRGLFVSALFAAPTMLSADQCCYPTCGSSSCNPAGEWCSQSQGQCEGSCNGHFCPDTPTPPPPPPGPTPAPLPMATYCPDPSEDFHDESGGGTSVAWSPTGWTIKGGGRVSSKASFNMVGGGYIEWDMDLGGAHGNVNTNFYLTYPSRENCGISCYCDSGGSAPGCAEMDLTENNGGCWQATTWHPRPDGSDHNGEAQEGGLSGGKVHFKAQWDASGNKLQVSVGGNQHSGQGLVDVMTQFGGVIYSSQWVGWVPGGNRCGSGDLGSSVVSVSNLKIKAKVVQGPEPKKCTSNSTVVV